MNHMSPRSGRLKGRYDNATFLPEQPCPLHLQYKGKISLHRSRARIASLALYGRNRQREWNESAVRWWAADHVHVLLSLPATLSVAKAIQLIKGGSSKWIHDQFPQYRKFAWQDGYGAFSVSASQVKSVTNYIKGQKEHHRKRTFEEEFLEFLDKYAVEYDRRYLFR